MGKLIEIRDEELHKAFEVSCEEDAVYFLVKCSDNKHGHRMVKIKWSDVLYKMCCEMSEEQRQKLYLDFNMMMAATA